MAYPGVVNHPRALRGLPAVVARYLPATHHLGGMRGQLFDMERHHINLVARIDARPAPVLPVAAARSLLTTNVTLAECVMKVPEVATLAECAGI